MKSVEFSVYQHSNTGTQLIMAMFVSRLPVGMPRSELEEIHVSKAAVRSARGERLHHEEEPVD